MSKWLHIFKPQPSAKVRLVCFHHAGGSSQLFHSWASRISSSIELCGVQLPGRWNRFNETPFQRMGPLVESCADALKPFLAYKKYAFFGHSLGALVSFELTRYLMEKQGPLPTHLFLSSRKAPQIPHSKSLHQLSDYEFEVAISERYGALPPEITRDPEIRKTFLGIVRTDMEVLETYQYKPSKPIDMPVTVYGGLEDPVVSLPALLSWKEHTTGPFQVYQFPGDHFYLKHQESALLDSISKNLNVD